MVFHISPILYFSMVIFTLSPCTETRSCVLQNCILSQWSDWSMCSASCGDSGIRQRSRRVLLAASCGGSCRDEKSQTEPCNRKCCPENCEYTPWSKWKFCYCAPVCPGKGKRYFLCLRDRKMVHKQTCGGYCDNNMSEKRCSVLCCYRECILGDWSLWGACEGQCGQPGLQQRTRKIDQEPKCGGEACEETVQEKTCKGACCPVDCKLGEWGEWSVCDVECGEAVQTRSRFVQLPMCFGKACDEEPVEVQNRTCSVYNNVDCEMNVWGAWSACVLHNGYCGEGNRTRYRSVLKAAECRGKPCPPLEATAVCYGQCCQQDCEVTEWSKWGYCSSNTSCGIGQRMRHRTVSTPNSCGGSACPVLLETKTCKVERKLDCEFSKWSEWSACSTDCGEGEMVRTRSLLSPAYCGGECIDDSTERRKACSSYTARRDCKVTEWSDWSVCERNCEMGIQLRNRSITQNDVCGGLSCDVYKLQESRPCHEKCSHLCNNGTCSCQPGYKLDDNAFSCSEITCDSEYTMSKYCPPNRRYIVDCRPTRLTCTGYRYGASCTARCVPSTWKLSGGPYTIVCQRNGTWSKPKIYCSPPNLPPVDLHLEGITDIEENTPAGECIARLKTETDPDEPMSKHTYDLVDDPSGRLYIEKDRVCLKVQANYETPPTVWNVTIRTTDIDGAYVQRTFLFSIKDKNDPPISVTLSPNQVAENSAAGVEVGCLTGRDDDVGQTLTLTLVNTDKGNFESFMQQDQLCIKVAKQSDVRCSSDGGTYCILNREVKRLHTITILAEDDGVPPQMSYFDVNIELTDVNDKPTAVELYPPAIPENVPAGGELLQFKAVDEDKNQRYSFSLMYISNEDFALSSDGVLTATKQFDHEMNRNMEVKVTVSVTDDGSPPLSAVVSTTFGVSDVNEPPFLFRLTSNNAQIRNYPVNKPQLRENSPAAIVGKFSVKDEDAHDEVTVTLLDDANGRLRIPYQRCSKLPNGYVICSGLLLTLGTFDYETEPSVKIRALATDRTGLNASLDLDLEILDGNDAPQTILLNGEDVSFINVTENENNKLLAVLMVIDEDVGDEHEFVLSDSAGGRFIIVANQLMTSDVANLNYEDHDEWSIKVIAKDNGQQPLSVAKVITVYVSDVNEAPYTINPTTTIINENTEVGEMVTILSTNDPDNVNSVTQNFTYELIDDKSKQFAIRGDKLLLSYDPSTCDVCGLDYERQSLYSLKIRVTDSGVPKQSREFTLKLSVLDRNDPPRDVRISSSVVRENEPPQTVIGTLAANDDDVGQIIKFRLSNHRDIFTIHGGTNLMSTVSFNHEERSSYDVMVIAIDSGVPPQQTEATITITVSDINEVPTMMSSRQLQIDEGLPPKSLVSIVKSYDPDNNDPSLFFLKNHKKYFEWGKTECIDNGGRGTNCSVNLVTSRTINFEVHTGFALKISIQDGFGLGIEKVCAVAVGNINEPPTDILFDEKSVSDVVVAENMSPESTVTHLSASDPDHKDKHTYSIVNASIPNVFMIRLKKLVLSSMLNYETQNIYSLTLQATDSQGLTFQKSVTITVTDVNEAPTSVTLSDSLVLENSDQGTVIGTLTTTDPDNIHLMHQSFTYSLLDSDEGRFKVIKDNLVVAKTNDDCLKKGGRFCWINFEKKQKHVVVVMVTDSGIPSQSAKFDLELNVIDTNDKPRNMKLSADSLREMAAKGSRIGVITISDEDTSQTHTYRLVKDDSTMFSLSADGVVTKSSAENFSPSSVYRITVSTTDSGTPPLSEQATFTFTVIGKEETTMELKMTSKGSVSAFRESEPKIKEDSGVGSVVGTLVLTNINDLKMAEEVSWQLVQNDATLFSLDNAALCQTESCEMRVLTSQPLDFETLSQVEIIVQVTKGLEFISQRYSILIIDVNEPPRDIEFSSEALSISENLAHEYIGQFMTVDPDRAEQHTYRLLEDVANITLTRHGKLSTIEGFDYEVTRNLTLRVETRDKAANTYSEVFVLHVTDVNEAPSQLSLSNNEIDENSYIRTPVGDLIISDPDNLVERKQYFSFTLIDDAQGRFAIISGKVVVALDDTNCHLNPNQLCLFDFEEDSAFTISVNVMDNGNPPLSETFSLDIFLRDVNEAPYDLSIDSMEIAENYPIGSTVATVTASDYDTEQSLEFSLIDNEDDMFEIIGNTLKLNGSLDFESRKKYDINILAKDDGIPPKQVMESFTIFVTNINEAPGNIVINSISGPGEAFVQNKPTISEVQSPGTRIGRISAVDPDNDDHMTIAVTSRDVRSDVVQCEMLIKGTQCSTFLVLTRKTDYETVNIHTFTVTVRDKTGLSYTHAYNLTVLDFNDPPTVAYPTNILVNGKDISEIMVLENTQDEAIAALSSVDQELDQIYSYSVIDGSAAFYTKGNQLWVTSAADLDYETQQRYTITVRVTDSGSPTQVYDKLLVIFVTDLNEAPSNVILSQNQTGICYYSLSCTDSKQTQISETIEANSLIGLLSTIDPDNVDNGNKQTFLYELLSHSDRFDVLGNELKVKDKGFNYEQESLYLLEIKVTDSGRPPQNSEFSVEIVVLDVNESPYDLQLSGNSIAENSLFGTVVGTLKASDDDQGQSLSFGLADDSTAFSITDNKLVISSDIDYEETESVRVQVFVTDDGTPPHRVRSCYSQSPDVDKNFTIKVNHVNEKPTSLVLTTALSNDDGQLVILESDLIHSHLGSVSVMDPDVSDSVTLRVVGRGFTVGSAECFSVFQPGVRTLCKASLKLAQKIDFETLKKKRVPIKIEAEDSGHLKLSQSWTLVVKDANEPPSDITIDGNITHVPELQSNITIGTLQCSDPDVGDTHIYVLVTAWEYFTVTNTDTLFLHSALDHETQPFIDLTIMAVDDGVPQRNFTKVFRFTVTNVNEKPVNISLSNYEVAVAADRGEIVGLISVDDPDNNGNAREKQTHQCTVLGSKEYLVDDKKLKINLPAKDISSPEVTLLCTDSGMPPLTVSKTFTISVSADTKVPLGVKLEGTGAVNEGQVDVVLGRLVVINKLTSQRIAGTYLYLLMYADNAASHFEVVGDTVMVILAFDYESNRQSQFKVMVNGVTDRAQDVYIEHIFTVDINDVNEAPTRVGLLGGGRVPENSQSDYLIGELTTVDPEQYQTFTYTIVSIYPGFKSNAANMTFKDIFSIVDSTLRVGQNSFLNYELYKVFTVRIRSLDSGEPPLSYEGLIYLEVTDMNDPPSDILLSYDQIFEDAGLGGTVGRLTVVDEDANQTHKCIVLNDQQVPFEIVDDTVLVTKGMLDYESTRTYAVKIECSDHETDTHLSFSKTFTISVIDVDEPPYNITLSNVQISEDSGVGATVAEISAMDPDSPRVKFHMKDRDSYFSIRGDATLVLEKQVNYEKQRFHTILITATDPDELSLTKQFEIEVLDANEAPTDISLAQNEVNENQAPHQRIGELRVEDEDRDQEHVCTVLSITDLFEIKGYSFQTGKKNLDYEEIPLHVVTVQCTDSGSPAKSFKKDLTIIVNDVNEAPVSILLNKIHPIPENSNSSMVISDLIIDDPDTNSSHSCHMDNSNIPFGIEFIDTKWSLVVKGNLDYETQSAYHLTIICSDGMLEVQKSVNISIKDMNEAPTSITLSEPHTVPADASTGYIIGSLSVTDPDHNQRHTFVVYGQNSDIIHIQEGTKLALKKEIPESVFEKVVPSIAVTVKVADSGLPVMTYSQTFTLTVINLAALKEKLPAVLLENRIVHENASIGHVIGQLHNIGDDLDVNVVFELLKDVDGHFGIKDNKFLVVMKSLQELDESSYSIVVQVRNIKSNFATQTTILINIISVSSCNGKKCSNFANCVLMDDAYVCRCKSGFAGDGVNCDNVNDCLINGIGEIKIAGNPCRNDGFCHDQINSYRCKCQEGFNGRHCEIAETLSTPCMTEPPPCHNDAACISEKGDDKFTCECKPGWNGKFCNVSINDCLESNCYGGGTCVDSHLTYVCKCPEGRFGIRCQYLKNVCKDSRCEDGICIPFVNSNQHVCRTLTDGVKITLHKKDNTVLRDAYQIKPYMLDFLTNFGRFETAPRTKRSDESPQVQVYVHKVEVNGDSVIVIFYVMKSGSVLESEEVLVHLRTVCGDINNGNAKETTVCPAIIEAHNFIKHTTSDHITTEPTTTTTDSGEKQSSNGSSLPIPIIAGAAGGGVVVLIIIVVVVVVCKRRQRAGDADSIPAPPPPPPISKNESRRSSGYDSLSQKIRARTKSSDPEVESSNPTDTPTTGIPTSEL